MPTRSRSPRTRLPRKRTPKPRGGACESHHLCRPFGAWKVAGRTDRPRVYELMEMPRERLREAQAGFTITLCDRLPRIEAERRGDDQSDAQER